MTSAKIRGELVVYYGPMFSGKTSRLIYMYQRMAAEGVAVEACKPVIDNRYGADAKLYSHDQASVPAKLVEELTNPEQILDLLSPATAVVIIDEVMFFSSGIVGVVDKLLSRGVAVVVAGLLTDSDGNDFGPTRALVRMADKAIELTATCDFVGCVNPATMSYAKFVKSATVTVGGGQKYGACCQVHHSALNKKPRGEGAGELLVDLGVYPGYVTWFEGLQLPFYRPLRQYEPQRMPRIEVGGDSMRVGKSTALAVLEEQLSFAGWPVTVSLEDWQNNPYLVDSYGDDPRQLLRSQQWFAKRKWEQLESMSDNNLTIQDVHPEMDFGYVVTNVLMGRMSMRHFDDYVESYLALDWPSVPAPDVLVYLKASDNVLLSRAKQAAREFETIDPNYFLVMKAVNRRWLVEAKRHYRVLEVDTDEFDFANGEEAKKKLGKMVVSELEKLGWSSKKTNKRDDGWGKIVNGSWDEVFGKRLVVMAGLPGSGKSYLAGKLKRDKGFSYLSSDTIRLARAKKSDEKYLADNQEYVRGRDEVYRQLHVKVIKRMEVGKKVVVDATYLGPAREALVELVKTHGWENECVFVVVKADEPSVRARARAKSGGKEEGSLEGWQRAFEWFVNQLHKGEVRYPDEKLDGVRVVEVWNG